MLPSAHRMRRSGDFRVAVRTGTRGTRPTLVVHLSAGDPATPALVGIVVSRSVGSAVTRNTVRRRLRPLLRRRVDRIPAGARLVVRALPPAGAAPSRVLADDLDAALERAMRRLGPLVAASVPLVAASVPADVTASATADVRPGAGR